MTLSRAKKARLEQAGAASGDYWLCVLVCILRFSLRCHLPAFVYLGILFSFMRADTPFYDTGPLVKYRMYIVTILVVRTSFGGWRRSPAMLLDIVYQTPRTAHQARP